MKRTLSLIAALLLIALTFVPAFADGTAPEATEEPALDENALYIIPDSNTRHLTKDELWGYTLETLGFIRNEIVARHGYAFHNMKYYDYFNAKPWYEAGGYKGYKDALSSVEKSNHFLIRQVEAEMQAKRTENAEGIKIEDIIAKQNEMGGYGDQLVLYNAYGNGEGKTYPEVEAEEKLKEELEDKQEAARPNYIYNTQYIIPDSDSRKLTEAELWAYTRETLRYIRNEILARHGYTFGDNKFGRYFGTKDWYVSGGYEDAKLSSLEWKNIEMIKKVERFMDDTGTQNELGLDITTIFENQKNGNCPG